MNELSNNISDLLLKYRSIIRPILERVSREKVEEFPKINDLRNLGDRYDNFLTELEVISSKNELHTGIYELLKEYKHHLPPVRPTRQQKTIKIFSKNNKSKEDFFKGGASKISQNLLKEFSQGEEGVVKKIYELCKQADIYPIEFDRLFYLIGSGRFSGLGDLENNDFKNETLRKGVYQPSGKNRIDIYLNFFGSFKDDIEKNFNSFVFKEMKSWVLNHYNEGLIEKQLDFDDIDSFIHHSYSPSLLEDEFPSENALIEHLIRNRYASGAPHKPDDVTITVEALQKYFKLNENLSIKEMQERASLFVKEEKYASLTLKNQKGNDGNLTKDINLLFDAYDFIRKKCGGSMENFYNEISMKTIDETSNMKSYEGSFIELVKEISNWKHYSFALSANFIKDYQLTRELRGLPKSDWKFKFASFTTKPDLHLINFTSFLSNRTLLDKFLENRLNN